MSESYPKRPSHFAHKLTRLLAKTCAAQEIGHIAWALVVTVAHTEDAKRYRSPVTFYNDQLLPILGIAKWDTLDAARKKAIQAGWLHYQSGGRHMPGIYWATTPSQYERVDDSALDEDLSPANGDNSGDCTRQTGTTATTLCPRNGDKDGDNRGDNDGEPSSLSLSLSRFDRKGAGEDRSNQEAHHRVVQEVLCLLKNPELNRRDSRLVKEISWLVADGKIDIGVVRQAGVGVRENQPDNPLAYFRAILNERIGKAELKALLSTVPSRLPRLPRSNGKPINTDIVKRVEPEPDENERRAELDRQFEETFK